MAYIAIDHETIDKPEMLRIAEILKITPEEALGRIYLVWRWADQETPDGRVKLGTLAMVDRHARLKGFGAAMESVKWLTVEPDAIVFTNWDKHNSKNAKARKLAARRAAASRSRHASVTLESRESNGAVTVPSRPPRNESAPTEQNRTEQNKRLVDGGGAGSIDEGEAERAAWYRKRPDWLPEGKPWIDRKACQRLAALRLTAQTVADVYREAKDKRNTLDNPAGYVIKALEEAAGVTA